MDRRTVVAGIITACIAVACSNETATPPPEDEAITQAIVQQERSLQTIRLDDGQIDEVGKLPTGEVAMSIDGSAVAYTREGRGPNPLLFVTTVDDFDDAREAGPGGSPVFSPDGDAVGAVLVDPDYLICPAGQTDPEAEGCEKGESIGAYSLVGPSIEGETALSQNVWKFYGWTADEQLFAGNLANSYLAAGVVGATTEEIRQFLNIDPRSVHAVSPVALTILLEQDDVPAIQQLDPTTGPPVPTDLPPGSAIKDVAWSPDGDHIAVVAQTKDGHRAFLVSASDGKAEVLGETVSPNGGVAWNADGGWVGFASDSEVTVCDVDLECSSTPIDEPVRILALR